MAKKAFDPVEETFTSYVRGSHGYKKIACRLADDGLRIEVHRINPSYLPEVGAPPFDLAEVRKIHLSPARCLDVLKGSAYFDHRGNEIAIMANSSWCIQVTTTSTIEGRGETVFDMFTMAKWLDCVAFPEEEEMHRRLWDELRFHRASHLISAPIEKKPDPEPIHFASVEADEIIEADFEQAEPVATTAIVSAEHQVEPAQQQSITGLGLRRFVRSSLLFARDVAVDVTSRIVSRSLLG